MFPRNLLLELLQSDTAPSSGRWLTHALPAAANGSRNELLAAYTGASRALGLRALSETPAAAAAAQAIHEWHLDGWTLEDAGRLLCLLERHASGGDADFVADATACYEQGDAREQASWLRGAGLLPDPARFLPVVIDACRTNILTVFEAAACDNPFPAQHFPELHFNQVVMKALFNGVALTRIVGLEIRANANLARIATDFAAERRAAGRPVPGDLALATAAASEQRTNS